MEVLKEKIVFVPEEMPLKPLESSGGIKKWLGEKTLKILEKNTILLLEDLHENDSSGVSGILLHILYTATDITISEILKNTETIMHYCEVISEQLTDLSRSMNEQFKKMARILEQQTVDGFINNIRPVKDEVDEAWKLYLDIQDLISARRLDDAKEKTSELIKFMAEWKFENMLTRLNYAFSRGDASQSVLDAQREILKLDYPFEHQIYKGMLDVYNYGVSIQTQLLTLYSEYATYYKEEKVEKYNEYLKTEKKVLSNLEIQADESGILDLDIRALDIETNTAKTQEFVFSDSSKESAYYVKLNDSGVRYVILPKTIQLKNYYKHDKTHYSTYAEKKYVQDHSFNGRYKMPVAYAELESLTTAAGCDDLLGWLKSAGELKLDDGQLFFLDQCDSKPSGAYYAPKCTQYLVMARKAYKPDPEADKGKKGVLWGFDDIHKNEKEETFPLESKPTKYGDAAFLRIYIDKARDGEVIKINDKGQIPSKLSLVDGNVLDVTDISGDMAGKTIMASGVCTIVGGGIDKTLTNLYIEMYDGAKLTIQSLYFSNNELSAIKVNQGKSTLVLENSNSMIIDSENGCCSSGIDVGEKADLTITGNGNLYTKGDGGGAGIENKGHLTIDGTTITAEGASTSLSSYKAEGYRFGAGIGSSVYVDLYPKVTFKMNGGKLTIKNSVISATSGKVKKDSSYDRNSFSIVASDTTSSITDCVLNSNGSQLTPNIILSGNTYAGSIVYKLKVKTSHDTYGGTDSKVHFKLIGDKAESPDYIFSDYIQGNALSQGDYEELSVIAPQWLGAIRKIAIKNPGGDKWKCEKIDILFIDDCYASSHTVNVNSSFEKDKEFRIFDLPAY